MTKTNRTIKKLLSDKKHLDLPSKKLGRFIKKHKISFTDACNFAGSLKRTEDALKIYQAIITLPFPKQSKDKFKKTERVNYLTAVNNAAYYISNAGDYKQALKIIQPYLKYTKEYVYLAHMAADIYAYFGKYETALRYVRIAVENGHPNLDQIKKSPDLKPLRKDPRFKNLFKNASTVVYNGVKMQRDFVEDILAAQKHRTYEINGKKYKRIPFGKEDRQLNFKKTCSDCAVIKGQFHVQGCDVEQCPRCNRQRLSCNCKYSDDLN